MTTPTQKALIGRIGGLTRSANCSAAQLREIGRSGYRGLLASFALEVDPEGVLPPAELARRVQARKDAHFARLALASSKKRGAKRKGKETYRRNQMAMSNAANREPQPGEEAEA